MTYNVFGGTLSLTQSINYRQAGQVGSSTACVCRSFRDAIVGRSAVRAQPWLLQRLLGFRLVTRCALVRNSLFCLMYI